VPAGQEGSAFVTVAGVELAGILCIQVQRQVGNDNCARFKTLRLQIPESAFRHCAEDGCKRVALPPSGPRAQAIDLGQSYLKRLVSFRTRIRGSSVTPS
jgi:hypothetical protein